MRNHNAKALFIALLVACGATSGGCPWLVASISFEPVTWIDFAALQRLTELVLDCSALGKGEKTPEELRASYAKPGTEITTIDLPELQVSYVLLRDDAQRRQTIILPGTNNIENMRLVLQVALVPDPELGIRVHNGFRQVAQAVRVDVLPRLRPDYRLELLGYSLGGGAAVLLSRYLALDGFNAERVLTLGQPRVTDAAGAAALAGTPLLRIISGDDSVTLYPSPDYAQFGEAVILLDGPYIVHVPASEPLSDLASALLVEVSDEVILRDHDVEAYRRRVASKVGVSVFAVSFANRGEFLAGPTAPSP